MQYVQQTVMLSGQTFNAITYNRRITVLTAVGQENKRAKDNLKENSEILEKARNELFGADFRKVIKEKAKARKDSNSVYRAKQRPSTSSTETGATSFHNKRHFHKGPSSWPKNVEGRTPRYESNNKGQDGGARRFPNQGKKSTNFRKFGKF